MSTIEEKMRGLEGKNRLLLDNLVDAVWLLDAETLTYEYITGSIEQISGYTPEELANTKIVNRLTPASLRNVLEILVEERHNFQQGIHTTRTVELEMIHKDGHTYWVEVRARFVKEGRKGLKLVGVTRDISARKAAEAEKETLIQELNDTIAQKERLLQENRLLRELLPICSGCKRIRDENEKWWPLEAYVRKQTGSQFTHTLCPDCQHIYTSEL